MVARDLHRIWATWFDPSMMPDRARLDRIVVLGGLAVGIVWMAACVSDPLIEPALDAGADSSGQSDAAGGADGTSADGSSDGQAGDDVSSEASGDAASDVHSTDASDAGLDAHDAADAHEAGPTPGVDDCGPDGGESCATSLTVTGGTFYQDGDGGLKQANVSTFKLDKYEITVGRFRRFIDAVLGGWTPSVGSGKHTHLHGGGGLIATTSGYESGWTATYTTSWTGGMPSATLTSKSDWDNVLTCNGSFSTWATSNDHRPINCVDWYDVAAFCIWDGGFLPSEAEWQYAASGGSLQRPYPWGSTAAGADANLAVYGCYYNGSGTCTNTGNIAPAGSVAAGIGLYGQYDLAGNVAEWVFDTWGALPASCTDCANVDTTANRVYRGGAFGLSGTYLPNSNRLNGGPAYSPHSVYLGARCARTP